MVQIIFFEESQVLGGDPEKKHQNDPLNYIFMYML